jgi:hypothetical protein
MKRRSLTERAFAALLERIETGTPIPSDLAGDDEADMRFAQRLIALRQQFAAPSSSFRPAALGTGSKTAASTPAPASGPTTASAAGPTTASAAGPTTASAAGGRSSHRVQQWRIRTEAAVLVGMLLVAFGVVWGVLRLGAAAPPAEPEQPVAMLVGETAESSPAGTPADEPTATGLPTTDPYPGPGTPGDDPNPTVGAGTPGTATPLPTSGDPAAPYPGPGSPTSIATGAPTPSSLPPPRDTAQPLPTVGGATTTPYPTPTARGPVTATPPRFPTETVEPTPTGEDLPPTAETTPMTPPPSSIPPPTPTWMPTSTADLPETVTPRPSVSSVPPPPVTPTLAPPPTSTVGAVGRALPPGRMNPMRRSLSIRDIAKPSGPANDAVWKAGCP